MKSAFLLCEHTSNSELFELLSASLPEASSSPASEFGQRILQLRDAQARLFTVFEIATNGGAFEFDLRQPPDRVEPGVVVPDLGRVAACYIECRWEAWFVALVGRVAVGLRQPAWVLDSDGALWAADDIDPSRLVL
jgi:hypothetical protein